MTPATEYRLDVFFKAAGLAIAIFGIAKYFNDLSLDRENQAKSRSISYLDKYNFGELSKSRKVLLNFWIGRPQFVVAAKSGLMSEDNYSALFLASLKSMPESEKVWGAIFDYSYYFSEVDYCISSNICDQKILEGALCSRVTAYFATYSPALVILADRVSDPEALEGVGRLVKKCVSA